MCPKREWGKGHFSQWKCQFQKRSTVIHFFSQSMFLPLVPRHGLLANSGLPKFAAAAAASSCAQGKVRSSEVLSRSKAVGQGGRVMVARILWVGGGWECFLFFFLKRRSEKVMKMFFSEMSGLALPAKPTGQNSHQRSPPKTLITTIWHARKWTNKDLLIRICTEKKLRKLTASNKFLFYWYFVQESLTIACCQNGHHLYRMQ